MVAQVSPKNRERQQNARLRYIANDMTLEAFKAVERETEPDYSAGALMLARLTLNESAPLAAETETPK